MLVVYIKKWAKHIIIFVYRHKVTEKQMSGTITVLIDTTREVRPIGFINQISKPTDWFYKSNKFSISRRLWVMGYHLHGLISLDTKMSFEITEIRKQKRGRYFL